MSTTRSALLDAAYDAAVGAGWSRARMGDVARAAGVSRQTLYYEFGSKDGLAAALAMREAQRFVAGSEAAMDGHDTPAEAVAAGLEYTLAAAADNPLLKAVLTDDASADSLLPYLTTRGGDLIAAVRARNAAYVSSHWPDLPREEVELVADVVVRLAVSHLVLPGGRPDETARSIAHLVERLLPGTPLPLATPQGTQ